MSMRDKVKRDIKDRKFAEKASRAGKATGSALLSTLVMATFAAGIIAAVVYFNAPSIFGFVILLPSVIVSAWVALGVVSGFYFVLSWVTGWLHFGQKAVKVEETAR